MNAIGAWLPCGGYAILKFNVSVICTPFYPDITFITTDTSEIIHASMILA